MVAAAVVSAQQAYELGLGSLREPGPGLWPFIVSVLTGVLSLLVVVSDPRRDDEAFTRGSWYVLGGLAAVFGFIVVMNLMGPLVAMVLLWVVWLRVLDDDPWPRTILLAVCSSVALYALFVVVLGVPFPNDPLAGMWR